MQQILLFILVLWPTLILAQPYEPSPLGGVSFDASTYEQHGKPPSGNTGADIWTMSWASDGNIYAWWGDGRGWDLTTLAYSYLGMTRITNNPAASGPPLLTAVDVYGDAQTTQNWKPSAYVADASSVMRGFYHRSSDSWKSSWVMTSTDNGTSWVDSDTKVFDYGVDGVIVLGMAQAGQGYTGTLPGDVSDSYYYVYLSGIWAQDSGAPQPPHGDLYLARVPKADIATKASYEYISAIDGSNVPTWISTIGSKIPIFTDSVGFGYMIGVYYWPAIDRWILLKANSYTSLGVFEGETPWGPWKTLYYGEFRDTLRKFTYWAPQKWMSGSPPYTFWMAWSGHPEYDNVSFIKGTILSTDTIAPKAPTNLQVTTNSASQLTLSWTAPTQNADGSALADLAGYRIVYCTGVDCTPTTVISPDLGLVTSYQHTGRPTGTTHRYVIRAIDTATNVSADSEIAEGPTATEQTLALSATSTPDNWVTGPTTGQNKVTYVSTNDGNTQYITSSTSGQQQQYAVANPTGMIAADSILSVRVRAWATKTVSNTVSLVLTGVVGANTSATTTALTLTTYTEHLHDMATKPGGGSWTLTDVNNLEVRVQPNASRSTRVTMIEVVVTYVPDPAPKPPSNLTAAAISATEIDLAWTLPTQNADGSVLTDLAAIRVRFCDESSCLPDTNISPDLGSAVTTYSHTSLTTDTAYFYEVRAIDATGKVSARSNIAGAVPSVALALLTQGAWVFNSPGTDEIIPLSDTNMAHRIRRGGAMRLRLQVGNTGASTSTTMPIECNIDGGSYATLTTTCGSPGICLRANGGVSHGQSLQQQLPLQVGIDGYTSGYVATAANWPSVGIAADYAAEMEYDLAIEGMTNETVCCRIVGLDVYPADPGPACFVVRSGSSRRG